MIKKLRISFNGKTYDVEAELLDSEQPVAAAPAPAAAPAQAPASAPAPVASAPTPAPAAAAGAGDVVAPLSGVVVSIDKPEGSAVQAGDTVVTLEAMKMNTSVTATASGTVKKVHVAQGAGVEEGQPLVTIG